MFCVMFLAMAKTSGIPEVHAAYRRTALNSCYVKCTRCAVGFTLARFRSVTAHTLLAENQQRNAHDSSRARSVHDTAILARLPRMDAGNAGADQRPEPCGSARIGGFVAGAEAGSKVHRVGNGAHPGIAVRDLLHPDGIAP